jgi:hypothetical protein
MALSNREHKVAAQPGLRFLEQEVIAVRELPIRRSQAGRGDIRNG